MEYNMLKTNSYFDGKVMSIALENAEGKSTVGVMEAGEYTFGTSTVEYMTVISGAMNVLLPGESEWRIYTKGETFVVAKDAKFQLQLAEQSAYHCLYV
jgi:uncharacterized protein YaiE (UPF0345 family)